MLILNNWRLSKKRQVHKLDIGIHEAYNVSDFKSSAGNLVQSVQTWILEHYLIQVSSALCKAIRHVAKC